MTTSDDEARTVGRASGVLRIVCLDVLGPLAVFRFARAAGVPDVWSLVFSGLPPLLGVATDWIRWRTLEIVAAVVLGGITLSVLLAVVSNDPKVVLLEGTAFTAAFGLACLSSLARRRPLIFHFAQAFYGGRHAARGQEMDADYDTYLEARSFWRTLTIVWAVVYLVESAARVAVILIASTQTSLLVNRTVPWVIYAALMVWSFTWGHRLSASRPPEAETLDQRGARAPPRSR